MTKGVWIHGAIQLFLHVTKYYCYYYYMYYYLADASKIESTMPCQVSLSNISVCLSACLLYHAQYISSNA